MRILIACEESQVECKAFRAAGHEAYSCDLQECSGGHPEWHIQGDVTPLLKETWDMIIAHPPCTYISKAGACNLLYSGGRIRDMERYLKLQAAVEFFKLFLNVDCPRVAIENPIPMKIAGLPMYDQIVHPYLFGDPWYKATCYWLKGLPPLRSTKIVRPLGHWVNAEVYNDLVNGHRSAKLRSESFPGIASAMVSQWGRVDLEMQLSLFDLVGDLDA